MTAEEPMSKRQRTLKVSLSQPNIIYEPNNYIHTNMTFIKYMTNNIDPFYNDTKYLYE
jgi:hypothetical protein